MLTVKYVNAGGIDADFTGEFGVYQTGLLFNLGAESAFFVPWHRVRCIEGIKNRDELHNMARFGGMANTT